MLFKYANRFLNSASNAAGKAAQVSAPLRLGSFAKMKLGTHALAAAFDVYSNMQEGDDLGTALLKSGVHTALAEMFPAAYWSFALGSMAYDASVATYEWWRSREAEYQSRYQKGTVGGGYVDTQQALTMRQAAIQAIQGSKLNARSALGGEARILATGWFK